MFRNTLQDSFLTYVAGCLPRGSPGFDLVASAFDWLFGHAGVSCIKSAEDALLRILLGNSLTILGNARSVTSSYRMTNKAGRSEPRE